MIVQLAARPDSLLVSPRWGSGGVGEGGGGGLAGGVEEGDMGVVFTTR